MITGNSLLIKKINQMNILRTVQNEEPISRFQLAKATGLSNSTISTLVSELLVTGILKELGQGKSIGGRKPMMLGINQGAGYIIGVDIGTSKIGFGIIDLRAQVHEVIMIETPNEPRQIVNCIIEQINQIKNKATIAGWNKFIGCGIATPGFVDVDNGVVIEASNLNWKNVGLRKEIEYYTGLNTVLDNNANAAALGEHYYGSGVGAKNLLYISIGDGIGAGMIIDGTLMTGSRNAFGEIGHMKMIENGPICTCGRKGCLEAIASGIAISRNALDKLDQSKALSDYYKRQGEINSKILFESALNGDAVSQQIVNEFFLNIGTATGNLVNILNPDMVIFGGGLTKSGDYFLEGATNIIKSTILLQQNSHMEYKLSSLKDEGGILGAATLMIQQLFKINYNFQLHDLTPPRL